MSKPDDISKEAWDAAYDAFCDAVRDETKGREIIARAIMAATLAEREACEQEAMVFAARMKAFISPARSDVMNAPFESALGAGHEIAAAIRQRGEA